IDPAEEAGPEGAEPPPLAGLARGFRKRTLVTAKLMARIGYGMARRNVTAGQIADRVDEEAATDVARKLLDRLDGPRGRTMKRAQRMSSLDTSLPPKAQRVLARLQSASRPVESGQIAGVVLAELGGPPDRVFDRFEPEPFAAASIGQVHRAWLGGQA